MADEAKVPTERLTIAWPEGATVVDEDEVNLSANRQIIRKAREPGELLPLPPVSWPVEEFLLVRSRLSAAGPRYEVIERFALSRRRPRNAGSDTAPGS